MRSLKLGLTAAPWYHERSRAGIPPEAGWQIGQAGSVREGTWVCFGLRLTGRRIVDARYEVFGCPAAIAAAAWTAQRVVGVAPAAVASLHGRTIAELLALPVEKTGVALVVEDAVRAALAAAGLSVGQGIE